MITLIIVVAVIVLLIVLVIGIYNALIRLRTKSAIPGRRLTSS